MSRGGTISTVDVQSARVRRLTKCGRGCFDVDPAWSPDGTAIAFLRVIGHEWAGEVQRVRVSRRHITSLAIYGRDPAWAPDGTAVLVATSEGIVTVGADGSQTLTAPRRRGDVAWSVWSPDGTRVLYLGALSGSRVNAVGVGTMRPNGTGRKRLYGGPCCVRPPAWSGDGKRVAFSTSDPFHHGTRAGTFVIDADARQLRNLMRLTAAELAWQPAQQRNEGPHR
jgi:Tol biopolymer transport system component